MGINRFGATAESMSRIMLKNLGLDPYKDMTFVQVGGGSGSHLGIDEQQMLCKHRCSHHRSR